MQKNGPLIKIDDKFFIFIFIQFKKNKSLFNQDEININFYKAQNEDQRFWNFKNRIN